VFWHTGGLPGLFGHPEIQKLLSRTDHGSAQSAPWPAAWWPTVADPLAPPIATAFACGKRHPAYPRRPDSRPRMIAVQTVNPSRPSDTV
jgi:hypothetical protein